jgi:hypothetical protein
MKIESFRCLISWLCQYLKIDELQSRRSSSGIPPISPEMMLHCALCYLAGGQNQDTRGLAQVSRPKAFIVLCGW